MSERIHDNLPVLSEAERRLRRMLCIATAQQPYMDDGEAADCLIDYMRDSLDDIEAKLLQRGLSKLAILIINVKQGYDAKVRQAVSEGLPHPEYWDSLPPDKQLELALNSRKV